MDKDFIEILGTYEKIKWSSDRSPGGYAKRALRQIDFVCRMFYSHPAPDPCDILFLHHYPDNIVRTENLWQSLRDHGYSVHHEIITPLRILQGKMLCKPGTKTPAGFRLEAGLSKYLILKHRPRLVCTFMDAVPLTSFLRKELGVQGKSLNIAHCITDTSHLFSMFDFDYYFVFGRGSLESALQNRLRIGSTKMVLTGSPFIDSHFVLPPNRDGRNILFFSAHIPSAIKDAMVKTMELVVLWAKTHKEYTLHVKLHPLENPAFFTKLAGNTPNIKILPKTTTMYDALKDVSIVLSNFSAASIEAALLNRPTVVVSASDLPNYFNLEDSFLPRARDVESLQRNIMETLGNFDSFLEKTETFTYYHLEHTTDSVPFMVHCIESILAGKENFPYVPVDQELEGPTH